MQRSDETLGRPVIASDGTRRSSRGFTLLELLSVIAIIGILAALIFPAVGAARRSANKAKTRVQFSQWAAAIESFRSEYGYYPSLHSSNLVNGGATTAIGGDHLFHDLLAGKKRNGATLTSESGGAGAQNRKRISFFSFSDSDFTAADAAVPYMLRDAFDNISIAVLVDRNLDGKIDATDYASGFPAVATAGGASITPTSGTATADIPITGLRVGVALYCADPTATTGNPQFIFSWK
jgi:prepilin-type N-terminal cleavage/methylation domain-containing protein